jgi:hypothetical protein
VPASGREIDLLGGRYRLKMDEQIVLGSADAQFIIVDLFDYTCPHCRELHRHLEAARSRYGDQLSIVLVPTPLNSGCNAEVQATHPKAQLACLYARMGVAVWNFNRKAFDRFHAWLMEGVRPPPPVVAHRRAKELLAPREYEVTIAGPEVDATLRRSVTIYRQCGAGRLPKLILGRHLSSGILTEHELFELLESRLGMQADRRAE